MDATASAPLPALDLQMKGDGISLADELRVARAADRTAVGRVWHSEAYREALVPLAAMAATTSRVGLGTSVAQWTRTLPNMELAAANMHELSGGRFVLGLGSMPRSWNEEWHGIPYERPLRRMREYVEGVRALWRAGIERPVDYVGEVFRVRGYFRFNGPLEGSVPIYLGATRPGMTALAGEIADGVLFNGQLSPEYIHQVMRPHLEAGAEHSGRAALPVIVTSALTVCTPDRAAGARTVKADIAMHVGETVYWRELARFHGFEAAYERVHDAWRAGERDRAVSLVPDEAVDVFGLVGSPLDIEAQLARYAGVCDRVILSGPGYTAGGGDPVSVYDGLLELVDALAAPGAPPA